LYVCTSQVWIFLRKNLWGIHQATSMRKICIRVAYPEERLPSRAPKKEFGRIILGKKHKYERIISYAWISPLAHDHFW